jgi:hypothetical protein
VHFRPKPNARAKFAPRTKSRPSYKISPSVQNLVQVWNKPPHTRSALHAGKLILIYVFSRRLPKAPEGRLIGFNWKAYFSPEGSFLFLFVFNLKAHTAQQCWQATTAITPTTTSTTTTTTPITTITTIATITPTFPFHPHLCNAASTLLTFHSSLAEKLAEVVYVDPVSRHLNIVPINVILVVAGQIYHILLACVSV